MNKKIAIIIFFFLLLSSLSCLSLNVKAQENQLFIDAPSVVDDMGGFWVTITDGEGNPIEGVTVEFDTNSYKTNINGKIKLYPSVNEDTNFTITASKEGYLSAMVWITVINELHADPHIKIVHSDFNEELINAAIENNTVGGMISIDKGMPEFESYTNVTIEEISIENGNVTVVVEGDKTSTGRIIILDVDKETLDPFKPIGVIYDGVIISMAYDLNDVFDLDESEDPEYIITQGANGSQIIVSIPSYSTHEITVYNIQATIEGVIETIGGINVLIIYIEICVVAAIVFIGTIQIRKRL